MIWRGRNISPRKGTTREIVMRGVEEIKKLRRGAPRGEKKRVKGGF